jgi:hypothetical protein
MLRIKSKKAGFRRCGVAHPKKFVEYPDSRFSKAETTALKAEPMLLVEDVPEKSGGKAALEAMTVDQLKEAIAAFQPTETLKGVKKAELIGILSAHQER